MKQIFLKLIHNENVKSFGHTLITDIIWDQSIALTTSQIFTGDLSKGVLYALGYSIFRTILRAIREWSMTKFPKPNEPQRTNQ